VDDYQRHQLLAEIDHYRRALRQILIRADDPYALAIAHQALDYHSASEPLPTAS
jgi:hypothetical protein